MCDFYEKLPTEGKYTPGKKFEYVDCVQVVQSEWVAEDAVVKYQTRGRHVYDTTPSLIITLVYRGEERDMTKKKK